MEFHQVLAAPGRNGGGFVGMGDVVFEFRFEIGQVVEEHSGFAVAEIVGDSDGGAFGEEHAAVATSLNSLARVLEKRGDLAGAEALHREALDMRRRLLGGTHRDTLTSLNNLASLLLEQGNLSEAEPMFKECADSALGSLPPGDWRAAAFQADYGYCMMKLGRFGEAESQLLEGYGKLEAALGDEAEKVREVRAHLFDLYTLMGKPGEAERYGVRQ